MTSLYVMLVTKSELAESQVDGLVTLLGRGCEQKIKLALRKAIKYGVKPLGIYDRLIYQHGVWHCIAGQDGMDVIRKIRELLLK